MGYSPEKTEREGVEDILTPRPPTPVEFLIFYVILGNSRQNKAPPLEILSHFC